MTNKNTEKFGNAIDFNLDIMDPLSYPELHFFPYDFRGQPIQTNPIVLEPDYLKVAESMGPLWKYHKTNLVSYRYNTTGFRCREELEDIDWKNTSVLVGDSHVFGHACENRNTITEILTKEYGEKFVNMGIPGTNNSIIHSNAILAQKLFNPKKVVVMWSYPNRSSWFKVTNTRPVANPGTKRRWWQNIDAMSYLTNKEIRKRVSEGAPREIFDTVNNFHHAREWQLAREIHTLLGNPQYSVDNFGHTVFNGDQTPFSWIEPRDQTPYQQFLDLNNKAERVPDWNNPIHVNLLNNFFARDLRVDPKTKQVSIAHWGRIINKDIADKIYRENFK